VGIRDEINADDDAIAKAEIIKARRQRDSAQSENVRLQEEIELLRRSLSVVESAADAQLQPPKWLSPKATKGNRATLVVMLSDTHFDEVVDPAEVDFLNAYDRRIATMRLERWSKNVIKMARHYLAGVTYDGVVLILGGDIFSGDIHEELAQTNEDTMLGSLLYWSEQLAAAISLLADEFGKVHVAAVPGNHGRMTRKPRMKLRARTNFDWLLAKMLEKHFEKEKRVTFQVPDAADVMVTIYGQNHLITHGDQSQGGGGIGGIWPPVMRLRARKLQRYADAGKPFRTMWIGHWHQYISTPSLVVNGSLKGLDEFAAIMNFGYEPPQQALAVVTPEHGVSWQAPIFVCDREKEGW